MKLTECVYAYGRVGVAAATAGWRARVARLPVGEDVQSWVQQPERIAQLVERLPLEAHRLLWLVRRAGRATGLGLVGEMAAGGVAAERARVLIVELHNLMLLLPDDYVAQYLREGSVAAGHIHLRLPDAWALDLAEPPALSEELPEQEPPEDALVRRGDCARIASAALDLQRMAGSRPIKPTQTGWMSKNQQSVVERAMHDPPAEALALVELARAAGLLSGAFQVERRLRWEEPLYPLARELLAAWTFRARGDGAWLGGVGQDEGLSWLVLTQRRALVGVLQRMPVGRWVAVEALAERLAELVVELPPAIWRGRTLAENRLRYVRRVLWPQLSLLSAMGVVDLAGAAVAEGISLPDPPDREVAAPGRWMRVTGFGHDLLSGAPSTAAISTPALPINGLALNAPTRPNSDLLYRLSWIAEFAPRKPSDPIQRATITRARWLEAAQAGADMAAVERWLVACSGRPLPAEVRQAIQGWSAAMRPVRLYTDHALARFPTAAARDLAAATQERVGLRAVRAGAADLLLSAVTAPSDALVFDYRSNPPTLFVPGRGQVPATPLRLTADRSVEVDPLRADLTVEAMLARITVPTAAGGRRLDLAAIRQIGLPPERVGAWLTERIGAAPPVEVQLWLISNLSEFEPPQIHAPEVIMLPAPAARMLLEIPEARELLIGALAPDVLVLHPGKRPALEALLARLEVSFGTGLLMSSLEEMEGLVDQLLEIDDDA